MMVPIFTILSAVVILAWSLCLYRLILTWRRYPPPRKLKPALQRQLPMVSILVAARNEERNIERCVLSLLQLDYPHYEIIVVNDRSTDATREILSRLQRQTARLKVVDIETGEPGWNGKSYALHVGVRRARGPWFLFTDADTEHTPLSLRLGMQTARECAVEFLSLYPRLECPTFRAALIDPTASGLVTLWYPLHKVNDPASRVAFANGQYILIDRVAYERIGGHFAVHAHIMEDVALSRLAKRQGIPFQMAVGTYVFSTRMYHNLRDAWQGWKRNLAHLADRRLTHLAGAMMVTICLELLPLLIVAAVFNPGLPTATRMLAASGFLYSVGVRWLFDSLSRQPRWPAILKPLSALMVLAILLGAMWDVLTGKNTVWRGIHYPPAAKPES